MRLFNAITPAITVLVGTLTYAPAVMAQQKDAGNAPVAVTGCLAQGDEANEYSIKDESGKTYGLLGSRVNMKPHVGHKVTVTGTPAKENERKEKKEAKAGHTEESEHLRVTALTMVSTTCP
jgi:hypothetical protein